MARKRQTTPPVRDHLPKGLLQATPESAPEGTPAPNVAVADQSKAHGRATRSPDEVATRRHLEGAEQGPM
jgi:hypothetical protein